MAKKKNLTKDQAVELADKLRGTSNNIYHLAKRLFGLEVDDTAFDLLRAEAKLFRCEQCSEWQDLEEETAGVRDQCQDCTDEMDADMSGEEGDI